MREYDNYIILDHLWKVHRDELNPSYQNRLALFADQSADKRMVQNIKIYLAALNKNEIELKSILVRQQPGARLGFSDELFALREAFAYVATNDQQVIGDLLKAFEIGIPFGGVFDVMILLGRIGRSAGAEAANIIRTNVLDTETYIIRTRDRVLERLETEEAEWAKCSMCCYGYVHRKHDSLEDYCEHCLGIGCCKVLIE